MSGFDTLITRIWVEAISNAANDGNLLVKEMLGDPSRLKDMTDISAAFNDLFQEKDGVEVAELIFRDFFGIVGGVAAGGMATVTLSSTGAWAPAIGLGVGEAFTWSWNRAFDAAKKASEQHDVGGKVYDWLHFEKRSFDPVCKANWDAAKIWVRPRDPLILDLDGNGLETVGLSANIYFDHDADGVLTKTGWVGKDDALLVWDRNANGSIDNGAELFGDFTPLPNGTLAPNGFAALAALDSNKDGVIDASDPAFGQLKLWRDASQDGLSQSGELISLGQAGIVSLTLANTLKNQTQTNGNTLTRAGEFTRSDGSTSAMGEFNLAGDTFNTRFAQEIAVPAALKSLPDMQGSGKLRALQQAATQSSQVADLLKRFQTASTRAEQRALVDPLLAAWADSSGMGASLEARAASKYRIHYDAFGSVQRQDNLLGTAAGSVNALTDAGATYLSESYRALIADWTRKLHVLEAFNGQYFFNLPDAKSQTAGANVGLWMEAGSGGAGSAALPLLHVSFSQAQLDALNQAYDSLQEGVYASLVLQTRLKPYLDQVELIIDDEGLRLDARAMERMLEDKRATDLAGALDDLLELDRYAGSFLVGTGWTGMADVDSMIASLPNTAQVDAVLKAYNVRRLTSGDDEAKLSDQADIALGGAGGDVLYGAKGNDFLFGQAGDDRLFGGAGDDLLSGGAGDDVLSGDVGADTYVFGRGFGHDTLLDEAEGGLRRDTVRLLGLRPADIRVTVGYAGNLDFIIRDTGDTLSLPAAANSWQLSGVGQIVFDDGTVWSLEDALRASAGVATPGDDVLHGSSLGETIAGGAGNDILIGNGGDDVLDGGAGKDILIGSSGWNWIAESGGYRVERDTVPILDANGNDTYLFGRGDGQDTVFDGDWMRTNTDTLRFKQGVTPANVRLVRDGSDLVLAIRDTDDQITLKHYFQEEGGGVRPWLIERIAFDEGTVWSYADVQAMLLAGSDEAQTIIGTSKDELLSGQGGDDLLLGGAGHDTLDGGAGNDVLRGGAGPDPWGRLVEMDGKGDTYRFGRGDGQDIIIDDSLFANEIDRIEFKAGIAPADIRLERLRTENGWQISDDLRITIRDTGDTITVKNHFHPGHRYAVEEIVFADGTVWDLEFIQTRVLLGEQGGDRLLGFNNRDDVMQGGAGDDQLLGLSGDDTLSGGAGRDQLVGGVGSDTYRFDLGDGQDMLVEDESAGQDVVELGEGITPDDVTVRWTTRGDMTIQLVDGSRLTVLGQADPRSSQIGIEELRFVDGTVWTREDLAAAAVSSTTGDDVIVGGWEGNWLDGDAGNDRFQDLGGYDAYSFGIGDGHDLIDDSAGYVYFKSGIEQSDVAFSRDGQDLIVTLRPSGDSLRISNWLDNTQRIDAFYFDDFAYLREADVLNLLNVSEGAEILYGSPGNDLLAGGAGNSELHGREGDDVLSGGAGDDELFGEAGNDLLDGGPGRDTLVGGAGENTYVVTHGMGLDYARGSSLEVANDTVLFASGIRPEDVSVQLGSYDQWRNLLEGDLGISQLVIGIGGNDALVVTAERGEDLGRGAIQHFRFADGTQWSLADVIARADGGLVGTQWRGEEDSTSTTLTGSEADDRFFDYTRDSVTVRARGNDDRIDLGLGHDIISAGLGNDSVESGAGEDLIAGEAGDDAIDAGQGDDTIVFNYGDGHDRLKAGEGLDTLSFGNSVTPAMLAAALDDDAHVILLIDGGAGGSITLEDLDLASRTGSLGGLERIQFIDADGKARIFDLAGWLRANRTALATTALDAPVGFDGTGFDLTGKVAPAGGLEALAYAQTGDLFATVKLADNTPTEGNDLLYGTASDDPLDAGAGNDIVLGLKGNDVISGGAGNDLILGGEGDDLLDGGEGDDSIHGGPGADTLSGGVGRDELFGEGGGDTYRYSLGDGLVFIDDDHRVSSVKREDSSFLGQEIDDAPNVLEFGAGISPTDLRYSTEDDDLVIEFAGRPGDRLVLRGFAPWRATQTRSVDIIRFADDTSIEAYDSDPVGNIVRASDQGDVLIGTRFSDTLIGGEGDDQLLGGDGADVLVGGAGSDVYRIDGGWLDSLQTAIVEIWRKQDFNRIELGSGIDIDELHLEFDGRDLLLSLSSWGRSIRFAGFDPRTPGMQAPVDEIGSPSENWSLSFADLLARGIRILGTPNDDLLDGTPFSDRFEALEGNDTMRGGAGDDDYLIADDGGTDTIIDSGDDDAYNVLVLPEDTSMGELRLSYDTQGFLILDLGKAGKRVRLSGFDPEHPLQSGAVQAFSLGAWTEEFEYKTLLERGFDIVGTDAADTLKGTALADRIRGGDGQDLIIATPGGDSLAGQAGNDTYVVSLGDGEVSIADEAKDGAGNVLRFGPGVEPLALRNKLRFEADGAGDHVLLINYGNVDDVVRLSGFDPQDVLGPHAIERFEFADGSAVDYRTLVSWTFVVEGDSQGNALSGTSVGDRLYGYDGDDLLEAGAGDDVLTGGAGNDVLRGGAGRDAYALRSGDGYDLIEDEVQAGIGNVLSFGAGVRAQDVHAEVDGRDLLVHYSANGDTVRVRNYASPNGGTVIDTLEFADGMAVTLRDFMNPPSTVVNQAPLSAPDTALVIEDVSRLVSGNVLSNDRDPEGATLTVTNPGIRPGEYGVLALMSNGSYSYLLDERSSKVQGLGQGETVEEHFSYLVSDGQDQSAGELTVKVQGSNDMPMLSKALPDVQLSKGSVFTWKLPPGSFIDPDRNDRLQYSATLADGKPLPSWLKFDAATQSFSGTAPAKAKDKDSIEVRVVASDGHDASSNASDVFEISFGKSTKKGNEGVGNGEDPPPPGHATNQNDGPGTGPGQPGNKGRDTSEDALERFLQSFKTDVNARQASLPALALNDLSQWDARAQQAGRTDNADSDSDLDIQRHWSELILALNQLDAQRLDASSPGYKSQGVDVSALAGMLQPGGLGRRNGVDGVSLAVGDAQLKSFAGLREGVSKLPW